MSWVESLSKGVSLGAGIFPFGFALGIGISYKISEYLKTKEKRTIKLLYGILATTSFGAGIFAGMNPPKVETCPKIFAYSVFSTTVLTIGILSIDRLIATFQSKN